MEKYNIDVVENATKTVNIMPETPFEKVVADCMTDYLELRKAEEQGLLLRMPCKVGDTVYSVVKDGLQIIELKFSLELYVRRMSDFGKTVFLTREEAEQALKQMGE